MTKLLIRLFVKNSGEVQNPAVRERYGRLAGLVGIASNLCLFLLKIAVGSLSGSIAIVADAINNLSDCASSLITLAGFKLASMPADEQHPYGHARFEYISGLVVSFLIMAIGLEFLISSVRKIISPESVSFGAAVVVVLLTSIVVKLWQGLFNRKIGTAIGSDTLRATAADSINDVVATAAVLAGAVVGHLTGWHVDGWLGLGVAVFILISGVRLVIDTLNPLLGTAPDRELVEAIERRVKSYDLVLGVHDLIIHNYGPGRCFASVHVEVPASEDILVSHDVIDNIERDIAAGMGIELVVHLDPIVTDDPKLDRCRDAVAAIIQELDPQLNMHDFRMVKGSTHTNFIFDVVAPPRYRMTDVDLRGEIDRRVKALDANYYCVITVDRSYTTTRAEPGRGI